MAETSPAAAAPPSSSPAPAPRPKLAGVEQLDARIKELTSSQGELLDRIQKLKQEVQKWRSNLETQVKTCHGELLELKNGLNSEMEQLKSEMKEIRSAIQEEKGDSLAQFTDSEKSNETTKQALESQGQVQKVDIDDHMEEEAATQA